MIRSLGLLATTFIAAIAIETLDAIDIFRGVYLPPPGRYVATFVVWFVLGIVSGFGRTAAHASAAFASLMVLTMLVVGPFGHTLTSFLEGVSSRFAAANA